MSLCILSVWQVGEWGTGKSHKRVAMLSSHHAPVLKGPTVLGLTSEQRQSRSKTEPACAGAGEKKSRGLGWWLSGEESAASAGDRGSVPGPGRSPRLGSN